MRRKLPKYFRRSHLKMNSTKYGLDRDIPEMLWKVVGSFGPKSKEFEKLPSKLLAAQSDVDQNSEKKFREILGTLSTLPKGIPQSFQTFGHNVDRASSNNQLDGQSEASILAAANLGPIKRFYK